MKTSIRSAALMTSFSMLLAISAGSPVCWAVDFINVLNGGDFNTAANWSDNMVPTLSANIYYIQNNLTATYSSGSKSLRGMVVGNDSFGILSMTGGSLELLDNNMLELGRERFPFGRSGDYNNNGVVDAADFPIWRKTLEQFVVNPGDGADGDQSGQIDAGDHDYWKARFGNTTKGGNIIMTGSSTLTSNGAIVGRRTKGLLSVGPTSLVDVKGIDNRISPNVTTQYLRVGSYGADYLKPDEPGLEADGVVIVQGTLNANVLMLNEHGAKGEVRLLPGGKIDLNGSLVMSYCDVQAASCGLVANPVQMSSKVSITGSGGTFNVGRFDAVLSPPIDPLDPRPQLRRDIYSDFPAKATFSFTADAGGVTPITVVDNGPSQLTGTANIAGTNLVLNLDAYTSSSPLMLINAAPGHLAVGAFGTVTFLGSRLATVNYDLTNGDVFLNNFHFGAGAGSESLASSAVPEPSGLQIMMLALGLLLCTFRVEVKRQTTRLRGYQCLKVRA